MKNKLPLILLGSMLGIVYTSCSKTDSPTGPVAPPGSYCDGVVSNYATDVQPIINTYCQLGSNCHSPGSTNAGGELTDYIRVFAKRAAIRSAVYSGIMPQTGSLTTDQKKKIICWIDSGAPNN